MHSPDRQPSPVLAMTSNYLAQTGNARPYLERIARAGFTHVHWAHEWATDYLYPPAEMERIGGWLEECGLGVSHVHASEGDRCDWMAADEAQRRAGVALLANRVEMAGRLGGDVAIVHMKRNGPPEPRDADAYWSAVWRSLDELRAAAEEHGVRVAIENGPDNFDDVQRVLARYDDAYVGLCYDTGHGNLDPDGLGRLQAWRNRLIAVHLHDNNGRDDVHWMPFTGTVDWPRFAEVLAGSADADPLSLETILYPPGAVAEEDFLAEAYRAGRRILEMIAAGRS